MKKIIYYLLTIVAVYGMTSCSSSDDEPGGEMPELANGQAQTVSIPADQTSGAIQFTTDYEWTARLSSKVWSTVSISRSNELEWLTLSKTSGGAGSVRLEFTLQENTTGYPRSCFIIISSGGYEIYVEVTQTGGTAAQELESKLICNIQDLSNRFRITQFDDYLISYDDVTRFVSKITSVDNSDMIGTFNYSFPTVYVTSTSGWNYTITLNSFGFASHIEANRNGDITTYDLQYGGSYLEKFIQYKNGQVYETTELEWDNGDATQVVTTWNGGSTTTEIEYSTTENIAGLMLYDTQMWVDMDGLQILYYAGLIGVPTAHLIKSTTSVEKDGGDTYTFSSNSQYSLDSNGCPTQLLFTETENGQINDSQVFKFSWETKY